MTPTEQLRGQTANGGPDPCRGKAGMASASPLFARVAARLAELVLISTGQAADRAFDAMHCPAPDGDVATWQPPVRPGHWAAFTFYGARAFEPLQSLYLARLHNHGPLPAAQAGAFRCTKVNASERARGFLAELGLPDIRVFAEQLGYYLGSPGEWRDVLANTSLGAQAAQVPARERDSLWSEHLAEVAALTERGPVWIEVPVIFAIGRRPER
jgi:hypothetical protein